ncbi:MAG: hypothetical protein ACI97N_000897 [Cognaticolwellia sp.]|jgi:hypothetical protein
MKGNIYKMLPFFYITNSLFETTMTAINYSISSIAPDRNSFNNPIF